ncbi:MAG: CRISPR-associated protein Cas2 [Patescibacteria group bacterium]|jgi:hypothetical protein
MNTILISYDLRAPGKDYSSLWNYLESFKNWAKPLESVWLIRTTYNAERFRNDALNHIDWNDKIFVVDVTSRPSAWKNLTAEVVGWIGMTL